MIIERRGLLVAATLAPLLTLPGCAGTGGGFSLVEAIRRLLTLSSQRAFASLMQDNGFFDSQVARIALPDQLGGSTASGLLSAVLRTDAITSLSVEDALAVVRGGSSAATDKLSQALGTRLFEAMLPGVGDGLKLFDSGVVTQALKVATGIDFAGLRDDVTRKASDGIYRAIGREEAAIRANPQATGDPLIMAVFGLAR
jgi:Protein of unknown function (DUF4197)